MRLDHGDQRVPMQFPWGLINNREMEPSISSVATAQHFDMVFFEKIGSGYNGGAGFYVWTDPPTPDRGDATPQERVNKYLDQFKTMAIASLQPGVADRSCPCDLHSMKEDAFEYEGSTGHEAMGFQRVGDRDFGLYFSVLRRTNSKPDKDIHVVVMQVAPPQRFNTVINDARNLTRRIRWGLSN